MLIKQLNARELLQARLDYSASFFKIFNRPAELARKIVKNEVQEIYSLAMHAGMDDLVETARRFFVEIDETLDDGKAKKRNEMKDYDLIANLAYAVKQRLYEGALTSEFESWARELSPVADEVKRMMEEFPFCVEVEFFCEDKAEKLCASQDLMDKRFVEKYGRDLGIQGLRKKEAEDSRSRYGSGAQDRQREDLARAVIGFGEPEMMGDREELRCMRDRVQAVYSRAAAFFLDSDVTAEAGRYLIEIDEALRDD